MKRKRRRGGGYRWSSARLPLSREGAATTQPAPLSVERKRTGRNMIWAGVIAATGPLQPTNHSTSDPQTSRPCAFTLPFIYHFFIPLFPELPYQKKEKEKENDKIEMKKKPMDFIGCNHFDRSFGILSGDDNHRLHLLLISNVFIISAISLFWDSFGIPSDIYFFKFVICLWSLDYILAFLKIREILRHFQGYIIGPMPFQWIVRFVFFYCVDIKEMWLPIKTTSIVRLTIP